MWTHAPGCWFQSMYLKDELCFRRENPCMPTWDLKRKAKMHLLRANFPLNLGINNEQLRTISCMNRVHDKWLQGNALFHALLCEQSRSQKKSTVLCLGSSEPGHGTPVYLSWLQPLSLDDQDTIPPSAVIMLLVFLSTYCPLLCYPQGSMRNLVGAPSSVMRARRHCSTCGSGGHRTGAQREQGGAEADASWYNNDWE